MVECIAMHVLTRHRMYAECLEHTGVLLKTAAYFITDGGMFLGMGSSKSLPKTVYSFVMNR